jgi:hypothetical protein
MNALRLAAAAAAVLLSSACSPTREHAAAPPTAAPSSRPVAAASQIPAGAPAPAGGSVAARGPVAPPQPPRDEASRAAAAESTVEAYLAAAVSMFRTGDPGAFLAVTTATCGCRSLVPTARRLGTAGGITGFDVRVSSFREVDSDSTIASVVLADYVIPAHTEPATPGHPAVHERATRYTTEFYVLFSRGVSKVNHALPMRTWPA